MGSACRRERWPRRCSTRPANEHSAEVALRFQVERRGWPAQPHAGHERPARPRATTWPAPPAQTASDRTVRSPNDTWGDQLVPTEATALSSVRPLFLFPEAIQLYDRVVIRPGPELTASPLTVLEDMEDSALLEAAQGGDQLGVERLLRRHQSLLDAQGSRFFLPGGDPDDVAREAPSASSRRCASTAAAAARASAVLPPCITRQLSSAVGAARRAKHRQLTEAVAERPPSAPGPPCSAARTWSIWRSGVSSCGNSALHETGPTSGRRPRAAPARRRRDAPR
jgi:hypothetical protein